MPTVYKKEREDGLAENVAGDNKIVYASLAEKTEPFPINEKTKAAIAKAGMALAEANPDQPDLFYLKSVLVSVGWNKNDDVFLPENTWVAKATPRDKPFNYEHNHDQIIGHITDCWVIDDKGNTVANDLDPDDVPEKFHIVTPAVIYKEWGDSEDTQAKIDKLIEEIPEGKWFVSMECIFKGFDYAIADDGEDVTTGRVIARSKDTAYLTKYLRAYGGKGIYEGKKIGRVLKNITFSGKGLVKRPANDESVILAEASVKNFIEKNPTSVTVGYEADVQISRSNAKQESQMAEKTELDTLKAENEKLKSDLAKASETKMAEKITKLEADAIAVAAELDKATKAKTEAEAKLVEVEKQAKAAEDKAIEADKKAKEACDKLAVIEAETKTAARVALVKTKLGYDDEKAGKVVAKLNTLSDEDFKSDIEERAELVEAVKKGIEKKTGLEAPASKDPKKIATSVGKGKGGKPGKEAVVTGSELENAEADDEAALAADGSDEVADKLGNDVMSFFGRSEDNK